MAPAIPLAVHTYTFRDLPLDAALAEVRGLGLSRVELWIGHVGDPDEARDALARAGVTAVALGAGGFYGVDARGADAAYALAVHLGVPTVVAVADGAAIGALASVAAPGLRLCVENHWDQPLDRPRPVLEALRRLGGTAKACLDTGHALLAGVRPAAFVGALGPRLGHVHLKDARLPTPLERLAGRRLRRRLFDRPRPCPAGSGALDVAELRRALEAAHFDGVVALEHEGDDAVRAIGELHARWVAATLSS